MTLDTLLDTRPRDRFRLYLAERDSDPGVPTRILSPALTPTLPPTPQAYFDRLNEKEAR
jgi:hypothetical protein